VILGDPGSGKSSLIRYVALVWAAMSESMSHTSARIPVIIELGQYGRWECEERKDFVGYLEKGSVWHTWPVGLPGDLFRCPGRAALLLDGLDEIFDPQRREDVVNDIQRFVADFPDVPILLTSRVVGYSSRRLRDAEFRHFMLQDLDEKQIEDFIDRWHDRTFDDTEQAGLRAARLKKSIIDFKSIAMLAGNPLLLTMMAVLNRHQELPRDRTDLYEQASRVLLHQWDTERALSDYPGLSSEVGYREKTDILRRVAWHMQAEPGGLKGNLIDGATLTNVIELYLREELHFDQARTAARAVVDHLRLRNFILCFAGANSYAFVHRTFLEHFCASEIVHKFNVDKSLSSNGLIDLFTTNCRQDEWHEVLRLVCARIDPSFVGHIVESLADSSSPEKWTPGERLLELPLAVYCLSEVRNSRSLTKSGDILLQSCLSALHRLEGIPIKSDLVRSAKQLGKLWPHFQSAPIEPRWLVQPDLEQFWARFVCIVFADRDAVEPLAHSERPHLKLGALQGLTESWPDHRTHALLMSRGITDKVGIVRSGAIALLAENWPDETTRALASAYSESDAEFTVRKDALLVLATTWKDHRTRDVLTRRLEVDKDVAVRECALRKLAELWPSIDLRNQLTTLASTDEHHRLRELCIETLCNYWSDETIYNMLLDRAVHDEGASVRRIALEGLTRNWSCDPDVQAFAIQRACDDSDAKCRIGAIELLEKHWPNDVSRREIALRAQHDIDVGVRSSAMDLLARRWPDAASRDLIIRVGISSQSHEMRIAGVWVLAETWPDTSARDLIALCCATDSDAFVRNDSLRALAGKWPDESTRAFVMQRACEDQQYVCRRAAIDLLVDKWPDDRTRRFLFDRLLNDEHTYIRVSTVDHLVDNWPTLETRGLLVNHGLPDPECMVRESVIRRLCSAWTDQAVREILTRFLKEDRSPGRLRHVR
jgi:hypothetical protein